jgi:DNA-directed RNA polymerase II subunit RPB2
MIDLESMKDILEQLGYRRDGTEFLYNGMTGKKMKVAIYIGPTYYQRLKHMVVDKMYSRSRGPQTLLTIQSPERRSCDGGLRFGEMERDAIIAYGMSKFLKERLLDVADMYETYICQTCGFFAQHLLKHNNKTND